MQEQIKPYPLQLADNIGAMFPQAASELEHLHFENTKLRELVIAAENELLELRYESSEHIKAYTLLIKFVRALKNRDDSINQIVQDMTDYVSQESS
jgi:hypothetical protein